MAIYGDGKHNENEEWVHPKQFITDREYISRGGSVCPFCESENISSGKVDFNYINAYRGVKCNKCGKEWEEVFEMVGIK